MGKRASFVQIAVFLAFICIFLLLHLALPDRSLSGRESLQTVPQFGLSSLFSGRLTRALENYASDQFPFRERWIALKAGAELACGKEQNNGVFLCAGETLIEPFTAPASADLDRKLDALDALAANAGVPVAFALIPSAAEIWGELLPRGTPNDSQRELISWCYGRTAAQTADLYSTLEEHAAEPIYYRTDHHWTALGAYYGYAALGEALGYVPLPLSSWRERVVSEDFYGTAWSSSGFSWVKPDRISAYVEQGGAVITNYPGGAPEPGRLYAEEYLGQTDQYSYFYGGNTPLITVETGNPGPKLLLVRDSYMDSLSPFFFPHFSEIHILDLRYYKASLADYLAAEGFDRVLVCYSVKNFAEDTNLFLLAR